MTSLIPAPNACDAKVALRVKDACAALSIAPSTFWKLKRAGKIATIKIAGRTLLPVTELQRLVSEGTR